MNAKKFIIALIAVFIFISAFDYFFHGVFMKSAYQETANLWRPEEAMKTYGVWLMLGQFIMSLGFVALFTKAFKRGGVIEGAIYGLLVAIFLSGHYLIWYAVSPYPTSMLITWVVAIIIELVLAGIIVAFIYKSKTHHT